MSIQGDMNLVRFICRNCGCNQSLSAVQIRLEGRGIEAIQFPKPPILRLFQHTFGTHPEQPLATGYKSGILSQLANGGLPGVCDIGVCCNFLGPIPAPSWKTNNQGTIGCTPNSVLPWYLLCSTLGFLEIITHKYPLYRAYIVISHRGT